MPRTLARAKGERIRRLWLAPGLSLALGLGCRGACEGRPVRDGGGAPRPEAAAEATDAEAGDGALAPRLAALVLALGGPGEDRALDVAAHEDGSFTVTGGFQGEVDLDPGPGTAAATSRGVVDAFVLRLGADGDHLWSRAFGGPGLDEGQAVAPRPGGGAAVVLSFQGSLDVDPGDGVDERSSAGDVDALLLLLGGRGEVEAALRVGGPGADRLSDVAVGPDGGVAVVGSFQGTVDLDLGEAVDERRSAGLDDGLVLSLDREGRTRWIRTLSGPGLVRPSAVAVGADGAVFVTGLFTETVDLDPGDEVDARSSAGRSDLFVLALDAEGRARWGRTLGGEGADFGESIAATADGGAVAVGRWRGTVDLDPGPERDERSAAGRTDGLALRLDAAGVARWVRAFGGPGLDVASSVAVAPDGSVAITGGCEGEVDMDPGGAGLHRTAAGGLDGFVLRLDGSGVTVSALLAGGDLEDRLAAAAFGPDGTLVVAGHLRGASRLSSGRAIAPPGERADIAVLTFPDDPSR